MAFLRQTWTLTSKNLRIVVVRHSLATLIRAFVLPIALMIFLSFAKNLFVPSATFGIGSPHPIRTLPDALAAADNTGRNTVAFVNSGFTGGAIERVISSLVPVVTGAGKTASVLTSESDLTTVCKSSLRGVTPCFGAVVFRGSPEEGSGGIWNYSIRGDGALVSGNLNVYGDANNAEIYMLPLQQAVDAVITANNSGSTAPLPSAIDEYIWTAETQQQRNDEIRDLYQDSLNNFLGVAFVIGLIGISYHMTGFMASERETGMSTLIEAMMPTKRPWEAQVSRLLSYHLAFTMIYLPGWVIGAVIVQAAVFTNSNPAVVIFYFILTGIAMASMSIFGAAFFRRSQLSGVTVTIIGLVLAIVAQTVTYPTTGTVTVLSLLFPPSNFTYFISLLAKWEKYNLAANLVEIAPASSWRLSGIVLWIFLIIQIFVYPVLGALLERYLHGTTSNARNIVVGENIGGLAPDSAVQLEGFTRIYSPGFIRRMFSFVARPRDPVVAVDNLTLTAARGQILALLGANGSGKSTTLDSIAGTNKLSSGNITIDGSGGLGIAPQKNVLWDELTVEEHIRVFNQLKSPYQHATKEEIRELIVSVDLEPKRKAQSKTLSGGQKRKLQLGMMLTGGSQVCCVDEVSSGLDPISRRKIWDILLAERGRRTIIMTTHFLDEADLLADHIAILSKGTLRAEGSSVELKDRLGGGYRINVEAIATPDIEGVEKRVAFDTTTYTAPSSTKAGAVIRALEAGGIADYRFSGPTIEDVFLRLAEEIHEQSAAEPMVTDPLKREKQTHSTNVVSVNGSEKDELELLSGERVSSLRQTYVLFLKRCTIFKHNWFPYVAAFLVPILAAGLVTLFIMGQQPVGCSPGDEVSSENINAFNMDVKFRMVAGPSDKISNSTLISLFLPIYLGYANGSLAGLGNSTAGGNGGNGTNPADFFQNLTLVDSFSDFTNYIEQNRMNVTPCGLWLGDDNSVPTMAYLGSDGIGDDDTVNGWFAKWILDTVLTNTSIASDYGTFQLPLSNLAGNSLQVVIYLSLALCAYPGFFALYVNLERRRNVRGLQYSNGVTPLPLWVAYTAFDFSIVLVSSAIMTILFAAVSSVWYHVGYLYLIFVLYGLASILLAYNVSLFCANQLSAYAFTAAGQAVVFLVYLIAYFCTITYAPVNEVDNDLLVVHFVISLVAPIGSVTRALFLALNLFMTACDDQQLAPNPGALTLYGGPILYLIVQSAILLALVVWLDSGNAGSSFKRLFQRTPLPDPAVDASDEEIADELACDSSAPSDGADSAAADADADADADGLRVVHLTKNFGSNLAVDNVTFSVKRGEVFALLGPNGAGKSTTISLIRGDIKPSVRGGDVFVEKASVTKHLAQARTHLGVCPQFDAIDQMTVTEHLRFYARVRGIPDVNHNVQAVLRAVGLQAFRDRQAHALSGGNKRKLSLGIALMGNPTVVLLDEPSSGLDAAAKRIMWRTLAATVPGRSLLLTTHSMEEADALAGRAGILAKRMLAMGTADQLRRQFGDALHVHLVCRGAPRTSEEDVARVRRWVAAEFPGAVVEDKTYHGQMRFSIPASAVRVAGAGADTSGVTRETGAAEDEEQGEDGIFRDEKQGLTSSSSTTTTALPSENTSSSSAIGRLVVRLEEMKEELGIEYYSVSPTTLDQVFLAVVGRHNVQEEGYEQRVEKKKWWRFGR